MVLVDTEAAAVALGVTPRAVQKWVRAGRFQNHGTARRIRLDLYALMGRQD